MGRLGGIFEASWGRPGASWERLGAVLDPKIHPKSSIGGDLGRLGGVLGRLGGGLGASWAVLERLGRQVGAK